MFWLVLFVYLVWFLGDFFFFFNNKLTQKVVKFKILLTTFADLPSQSTLSNPRSIHSLRITSTSVICILLVLHCINN